MAKLFIVVACLALAALSASVRAAPNTDKFAQCTREVATGWLNTKVAIDDEDIPYQNRLKECGMFVTDINNLEFAECEQQFKISDLHKNIPQIGLSEIEWKVYERRIKALNTCNELRANLVKEIGKGPWDPSQLPTKTIAVDDTLTVDICAKSHLEDSKGFILPPDFEARSPVEQANICEEAQEYSYAHDNMDCYRKFDDIQDFPPAYNEAQMEKYNAIHDGMDKCEQFYYDFTNLDSEEDLSDVSSEEDFSDVSSEEDFSDVGSEEDFSDVSSEEDFSDVGSKKEFSDAGSKDDLGEENLDDEE